MEDKCAKFCENETYNLNELVNKALSCVKDTLLLKENDHVMIIKRNKSLHMGDFTVILPQLNIDESIKEKLITAVEKSCSQFNILFNGNSIFLKLCRKEIFLNCISDVIKKKSTYGQTEGSICQRCIINIIKKESGGNVTLDDVRSLLLAEHVERILHSKGYNTSVLCAKSQQQLCHLFNIEFLELGKDLNFTDSQTVTAKLTNCKYRHIDKDGGDSGDLVLNLQSFLEDNPPKDKDGTFDQNIKLANFSESTKRYQQLHLLQSTLELLKDTSVCVHVTPIEMEYSQQQINIGWKMIGSTVSQHHFVLGKVSKRQGDVLRDDQKNVPDVSNFLRMRVEQMKEAAVLKYGDIVQGPGWEETIRALSIAGIKFEILGTTAKNEVKLNLMSSTETGKPVDSKGGIFVMYNYARLATLFHNFESAVDKGTYPELPPIENVDFSFLKDEEEWTLLFNYVMNFPSVVESTLPDLSHDAVKSAIHTHKICQFLCDLSRDLSSYYRRIRILTESRPHLFPVMHARLYLMKAVQQVMLNGLYLLNIQPLSQL